MADLGEGPGGPGSPLFWAKKEEMTEGKGPAGQENQDRPPPLAQGLDPPLSLDYYLFPLFLSLLVSKQQPTRKLCYFGCCTLIQKF